MAKKTQKDSKQDTKATYADPSLHAQARPQLITDTIITNYMPYVMSVIVSRAIPEIDGFKPSHRKLLYTMYKMGLLSGARTKSTNVVGQTMRLNPHGDASIYETMVRLTRGHDALLHPFVDSKGTFGKHYSSEMAYAASRYTEVKLDPFCNEIFRGIDKNAVDMIQNYDNTMEEPSLLPTTFPNILVSANSGIAVGIASRICSFNLAEICDGTIMLLKRPFIPADRLLDVIKAPDFSGGGYLIYDRDKLREIYETGHGSVRLRAKYVYDKAANCIDILEIPYTTSIEVILKKIDELRKENKIKDIVESRDEIDLNGFKLTIDLKKGTDPDLLMRKLFKLTTLEDDFDCNFNVLINGTPQLLGVKGILEEWIKFRLECLRRETVFELQKLKDKLHLLLGLAAILLDIDLAIKIIRDTKNDRDVVPNLMAGFDIDEIQANYVADIKLRALNHEYITARTEEIAQLQITIAELEARLADDEKLKDIIAEQLKEIKKKYGKPRKTEIIMPSEIVEYKEEDYIETYDATLYLTERGYFKKIKDASLRMNDEQALVDGDKITYVFDSDNTEELYFFTDKGNAYRAKVLDFEACKASSQGEFVSAKLKCENDERIVGMICLKDVEKANGNVVYVYKNGKALRTPFDGFKTKAYRKKLSNVSATSQELIAVYYEEEPFDIVMVSSEDRALIVSTADIALKKTRTSEGNAVMTLKAKKHLVCSKKVPTDFRNTKRYRKSIPSSGVTIDIADGDSLK